MAVNIIFMVINVSLKVQDDLTFFQKAYFLTYHKRIGHSKILELILKKYNSTVSESMHLNSVSQQGDTPVYISISEESVKYLYSIARKCNNTVLDDALVMSIILTSFFHYFKTDIALATQYRRIGREAKHAQKRNIQEENVIDTTVNEEVRKVIASIKNKNKNKNGVLDNLVDVLIPDSFFYSIGRIGLWPLRILLYICHIPIQRIYDTESVLSHEIRPAKVLIPNSFFRTNIQQGHESLLKLEGREFKIDNVLPSSLVIIEKINKVRGGFEAVINPAFWNYFYKASNHYYRCSMDVVWRLSRCSSVFFYIFCRNIPSTIHIDFSSLKSLYFGGSELLYDQSDFVRRCIEPAKKELDAKSAVTFSYTYKRPYYIITPILRTINRPVKEYTLCDYIGKESYDILLSIGVGEADIQSHCELIIKLFETGNIRPFLLSVKSICELSNDPKMLWTMMLDFLAGDGPLLNK